MTDTIIKGSGNSRSIKFPPNAASMYQDLADFLNKGATEGIPIDLGPLNPTGLNVRGTDLNKASLLKDTTAALYGKDGNATLDDILVAIIPLITAVQNTADGKAQIEFGSYTGNGLYGAGNPSSLSFSFAPKVVMIPMYKQGSLFKSFLAESSYGGTIWLLVPPALNTSFGSEIGFSYRGANQNARKSSNGKTIYWYTTASSAESQMQASGRTYYYVAIG